MTITAAASASATTATTATTTSAVDALLKWKNKQTDSNKPQLLPEDEFIYLTLTLKKIPQKGGINGVRTNPNKIPLPHPVISSESAELCLIIDDRPNSKLTSEVAKKKIKADGISVSKVIKLSKLRTDYKAFEAKRKLCDSYDMFFADKRVIPLLPKLLGKQFFRKKKLPLPVDLTHKNWKEQIERRCCSGLLFFGTGTCSVIRVAKVSMERDQIVENVRAAIDGALGFVPKKMLGVRSLHLKLSDSVSLPLYQALPDIKLKIDGSRDKDVEGVEEEVIEVEEVKKKKQLKKDRIHEVGYDMREDEVGEDQNSGELNAVDGGLDKKKRKGGESEVGKKKRLKKGKSSEVTDDLEADEVLDDLKAAKTSVKEKKTKKTKKNAVEETDVNAKSNDKLAKKKGKKKSGDSGKKEKKKGRQVPKV